MYVFGHTGNENESLRTANKRERQINFRFYVLCNLRHRKLAAWND